MTDRPWQQAASFAARAHRYGIRKDGRTPYVAHVFRVAMTVRDAFGCDDGVALAAALLHDTIEDTGTDYDEILEHFGPKVARCVAALTKNAALPEEEREAEYDARLAKADWRARLVKLADTYDNFLDAVERDEEKLRKPREKCRRAMKLAQPDAARNECVRRAIVVVQEAIGPGKRRP